MIKKTRCGLSKRGFTDKLYFANLSFAWGYTILCVVLSIMGNTLQIQDYSFVSVVCPLVWTELGIHSAFIIWKSKSENMKKFNKDNITM